MAWEGSDRSARLPANWPSLVRQVEQRAQGRCQVTMRDGSRCRDRGTQCDHIQAGDDHSLANLQWICEWHHARKSAAEGNAARTRLTSRRPAERHPGLA